MNKQSFKTNILDFIMLISGTLTILIAFSDIIINKFVEMRYDIVVNSSEAQSIGIIGGADGPTAIFLTGTQGLNHKKTAARHKDEAAVVIFVVILQIFLTQKNLESHQ